MQFKYFHWHSHHGMSAITPCSAIMVSVRVIFGGVFILVY